MRTQLSLMPDLVPHRALRVRAREAAPALPANVERLLVELAPRLPAQSLPAVHPGCVEIPVLAGTALESELSARGFTVHAVSIDPDAPMRVAGWRFWRLDFTAAATP